MGEDAQLRAAVDELLKQIKEKPAEMPVVPRPSFTVWSKGTSPFTAAL